MAQQSMTGFGVAHPVPYAPKTEDKKSVEKSKKDDKKD